MKTFSEWCDDCSNWDTRWGYALGAWNYQQNIIDDLRKQLARSSEITETTEDRSR